jgi:hypothetical protein
VVISGGAAEKDVEAGVVMDDDRKISAQTNMQSASAFMSKILLVFGLGRGNWNVGNNPQLTAARKRLLPSYATTVCFSKLFIQLGTMLKCRAAIVGMQVISFTFPLSPADVADLAFPRVGLPHHGVLRCRLHPAGPGQ